ncbi:MAG: GNAT family protein [Candidatus Eiseniibacteriota bacterium]
MEIHGPHIMLRDWRLADLESLRYWLSPEREWHRWDGPYYPRPNAREIARRLRAKRELIVSGLFPTPRRSLAIAERTGDRLLGQVIWYWQSQETDWLSAGIAVFDPRERGRGAGYAALGLWCDYLWQAMPSIVRLDLRTWSGNGRMIRLAEKLGFREEARFRKARIVEGTHHDGLGFGVLREEWEGRYPGGFAAHLGELERPAQGDPG